MRTLFNVEILVKQGPLSVETRNQKWSDNKTLTDLNISCGRLSCILERNVTIGRRNNN